MKIVKIITNPYTLIISFLIIIISGQHLGNFYIFYILMALPHFGIYALLAVTGIVLILIEYHRRKTNTSLIEPIVNLAGVLLLLASIFIFFYIDNGHYNYGTFYQLVPQITLILFLIIAVITIVIDIMSIYRTIAKKIS